MIIKWIGACLILVGCGGFGFAMVAQHHRTEQLLRQLLTILDYMDCQLQYQLTPLPDLCIKSSEQCKGILKSILKDLNTELENQIAPDVERCMCAALSKYKDIPENVFHLLESFGKSLGRFDLNGQLKGLSNVKKECNQILDAHIDNKVVRLRSYKTLALCAGAAIVILFL